MKLSELVTNLAIFCLLLLIGVQWYFHKSESSQVSDTDQNAEVRLLKLLKLAKEQNETITELWRKLPKHSDSKTEVLLETIRLKDDEIARLRKKKVTAQNGGVAALYTPPMSALEFDCENRYGMRLVENWRSNKQTWCQDSGESVSSDDFSELICYPYHQTHKKLDGRGPDLFCEAKNFYVDFSKVWLLH